MGKPLSDSLTITKTIDPPPQQDRARLNPGLFSTRPCSLNCTLDQSHAWWISSLTSPSCTRVLLFVKCLVLILFLVRSRSSFKRYFCKGNTGSILSDFDAGWHVLSSPNAAHSHVQVQPSLVRTSRLGSTVASEENPAPSFA